jgi:TatD DNase family protein
MLVDTHLHLDFEQFDKDRADVVTRAVESGVTRMITIGTSLETSRRAIELAEAYEPVWAAVGIHPNDAVEWGPEAAGKLREWANHPRVVAIGEIGLDYYWERVPHDVQQRAFAEQLALARELGLPVIVHDREAHEDLMAILRHWVSTLTEKDRRGVLHFFSGDRAMGEEALGLGFYIGTDGPITYKNARELQEVIASVPLDRLLVETDAPFLSPHPHRGKRNEPAFVRRVAEQVGQLHAVSYEEVAARTTRNACNLFGLE